MRSISEPTGYPRESGGCRAPGPHAIATRTAVTTTTSSICLRPWRREPGSSSSAVATGVGITVYMYQSTLNYTSFTVPIRC